MSAPHWIALAGAANVRDVAGLPTVDGRHVRPDRLIRADNLQGLTAADVRELVDVRGVRSVADLRTGVEVRHEGPGPMTREPLVRVEHLSLFPEAGRNTDAAADDVDPNAPVILPWQTRDGSLSDDDTRRGASGIYLRYLDQRPDSALAALRLIAHGAGATIVHCAAGKDRTGVVVALALAEVGVTRAAIVADYTLSAERIEAIFARLRASSTYAGDLHLDDADKHRPRAITMERLLDGMDEQFDGVPAWLRTHGWTEDDAAALRASLLA